MFLTIVDSLVRIFPTSIRYGLRSTQLVYSHPTVFVACCALLVIVLLTVKDCGKHYKVWLVIQLILMCTTLRSKAFATAMAIALVCYFVFYRKKKFSFRTLILFVPLTNLFGTGRNYKKKVEPIEIDADFKYKELKCCG